MNPVQPAGRGRGQKQRVASATRARRWFSLWRDPIRFDRPAFWRELKPTHVFVGSFLLLILLGTLGLRLLPGLYTGPRIGWLDALFTATSAVCVTGLVVVDTATYFTTAGQAFLLLLIQLGGLGMITFATLIILGLGGRLSLRHEALATAATEVAPHIDHRRLTRTIVLFTLSAEAIGAILLWFVFAPRFPAGAAAWHAVFQAVSAFCNAGFSTFSDSLISVRESPLAIGTITLLIVTGGLGFLTLEEMWVVRRHARDVRLRRLSLHSRLVLTTTALLLAGGAVCYALFEWRTTLAQMPAWVRIMNALFMSATARTAGFNTVDYAQVNESTSFFTIILMYIGGSPGSTAGGVKTTTVALIVLLAWARVRGRMHTSVWNRTVPPETLQRSIGLLVIAGFFIAIGILLYTVSAPLIDPHPAARYRFLARVFEAVSAFGTVGLSMGITSALSDPGKWITIVLMFVGRVGPLAFAAAIALPERRASRFRFAHEDVIVG